MNQTPLEESDFILLDGDPFQKIELKEIYECLCTWMEDNLEKEDREAVRLRYCENLTLDSIAGRMGVSPRSVRYRIQTATQKLRENFPFLV